MDIDLNDLMYQLYCKEKKKKIEIDIKLNEVIYKEKIKNHEKWILRGLKENKK
jgi:hypothetical protein